MATAVPSRADHPPAPPTPAQRVAARRALERVDYAHVEWPEGSRSPQPPFEELYPETADEAAVGRALQMGSALERLWGERVSPEEIQTEIDRMVGASKMPDRLQEYFAALGNDPALVAEVLVRPRLTEQRLRERYAQDPSLHAVVREEALADLHRVRVTGALGALTAERSRCLYLTPERLGERGPGLGEVVLDGEAWHALRRRLAGDGVVDPAAGLGPLQESPEGFFAQRATEVQQGALLLTTYTWSKRPFDAWWEEVAGSFEEGCPAPALYRLPSLPVQPEDAHESWSALSTSGAPAARRAHAAVWTGSRMVIWGGQNFAGLVTSTGGLYDPATDSWSATTTTGAPSARSQYRCVVWTGTHMVVWGGEDGVGNPLSTGARYSPAGNTWSALSTTNAPSARSGHSAVYNPTTARIVVWGGTGAAGQTNTGKNLEGTNWYNQAATSTFARMNHAAAYDSTVAGPGVGGVVLWGGSSSALPAGTNTGATYSSGDGWVATATTGAPSAREFATGLWRPGQYFIVWGGNSGSTVLGDGARWAPTDAWTALSSFGAPPAARTFHTAVWAGGQTAMVVWGGQTLATNAFFANGALYYPVTQSWTALSTAGSPAARALHTAVYASGTSSDVMLVWGGNNGTAVLDTGGAYHFCRATAVPSTTGTITAVDLDPSACTATGVQVTWPQEPTGGWGDDGFGPRSYTVLRDAAVVGTLAYPATTTLDLGGTPNTAYTYSVRYTNGCGHSVTTAGAPATDATDTAPCPAVGGDLMVSKAGSDAALTWGAVACADLAGYRVYGATAFDAAFPSGWTEILPAPAGASAADSLASAFRAYRVVSRDACGNASAQ